MRSGLASLNISDKANTLARVSANQALLFAIVANSLACGIDTAGQLEFRYDASAPDCGHEVVLADDPIAVRNQICEQIEYLGLQRDLLRAALELPPLQIKYMIGKEELHVSPESRGSAGGP